MTGSVIKQLATLHSTMWTKTYLFLPLFFILSKYQEVCSQNLIENGDFEEYFACPKSFVDRLHLPLVPGWRSLDEGTPDYFNRCSKLDAGVPYNWAGVSDAWSGDGYAGIYVYHHTGGYAEYLKTDLVRPLERDRQYIVSFYYKLSSYSPYSIDRIGFMLGFPGNESYLREFIKKEPLDPKTGSWEYVIDTITARGGESNLTIGNFSKGNTRSFLLKYRNVTDPMLKGRSYYYIDNVRLELLEDRIEIPEADTLLMEKTYTFQNILFEFDKAELIDSTREEIASLAAYLMERINLHIEIQGHTDESGTAAYNQTLSESRAKAVADYLHERGVGEDRISFKGFGETMPVGGEGEKNRRVEFVLTFKERE